MDVSLRHDPAPEGAYLTPSSIVVPLDGSAAAETGLLVARWLSATLPASVQRVTVETGPDDPVALVEDDGGVEYVLHGDSVAAALSEHLERQPGSLLCMASRARGGLYRRLSGNLVDQLVASGAAPMVVIGPGCEGGSLATPPATLLLAASHNLPAAAAELCGRWAMAMDADVVVATVQPPVAAGASRGGGERQAAGASRGGGGRPPAVEVSRGVGGRPAAGVSRGARLRERAVPQLPSNGFLGGVTSFPAGERDALLGPLVRHLDRHGVASEAYNLMGGTVATSMLAFAESLRPPVLIVAPVGDRDGRIPGDVTHQLLQRSRWPVVASLGRAPIV